MFFILIKNYIIAWFESIGWYKKISRIKTTFEIGEYKIYIDMFSSHPRRKYDKENIISYYKYKLEHEYSHDRWKIIIDTMAPLKEPKYAKTLKDFIETVVLTDIDPYGLRTFINKLEIKTKADIRDEKINKLLSNN